MIVYNAVSDLIVYRPHKNLTYRYVCVLVCIGYVAFMRLVFPWHSKRLMIVESRIDYIPIKHNLIAIMFLTRKILFHFYFGLMPVSANTSTSTNTNSITTPLSLLADLMYVKLVRFFLFKELLVNWFRFVVLDNNIINHLILNFANTPSDRQNAS